MEGIVLSNSGLAQAGSIGAMYSSAAAQQNMSAPKELGIMQRVEGLRGGLDALSTKLDSLCARIAGHPSGKDQVGDPMPAGLQAQLSLAEERLRAVHNMVDGLNNTI